VIPKPFDTEELDEVVHARGRLNIMAYLDTVEYAEFMQVVEEVNLPRGSVHQHLKKLEEAGYVTQRKEIHLTKVLTRVRLTELGHEAFAVYRARLRMLLGEAKKAANPRLAG